MKSPRLFICGALYVQLIRLVKLSLLRYRLWIKVTGCSMRIWGHTASLCGCHFCGYPKPFVHYFIRDNEKYGKFLLAIDIESIITGPHPE